MTQSPTPNFEEAQPEEAVAGSYYFEDHGLLMASGEVRLDLRDEPGDCIATHSVDVFGDDN